MIALSLHLRAALNRWLNILVGSLFTLVIVATMPAAPPFYLLFGMIEITITGAIVVQSWRWPAAIDPPPARRG
jgi:hypothetical protein